MKIHETRLSGLLLIEPAIHRDGRGFFMESYSAAQFAEAGISTRFIQDNHSRSVLAGTVRGLHFQAPPFEQAKLVRCVRGSVFDVAVDLRVGSPTYGRWEGFTLNEENAAMVLIPRGFAHGFCTMSDTTDFLYKVDNPYSPDHDAGIRWNDPVIGVSWPVDTPRLSDKDRALPLLADYSSPFRL